MIVFAHGAGAPSLHPWMQAWALRLATLGVVECFDYPYMQGKRRGPDAQPVLVTAHLAAIDRARAREPDRELFLIGKSMGSRIGCHAALLRPVAGLVCFGYPLLGAGNLAKMRDQVLLELETPILFVQGSRDPLCPLEVLAEVRKKMTAPNQLFVVEAGDHSLQVTKSELKRAGEGQAAVDARILQAVQRFLSETASAGATP